MPDPVAHGGPTGEPTPLDFIPALATVAELMTDAVAVTDLETLDRAIQGAGGVQPRG